VKTMKLSQATKPLAEYARNVASEPVILVKAGRPIAALVSLRNADRETVSLSMNAQFLALIERSRSRQKARGGISPGEMRRRLRNRKSARR
jgi:antitoxin (DNA-binding transcriptional repressor) of toxin-antitoxin stability system